MLAERDFDYIRDLVRDRAAIVLEPGKEYLAVTRLDPVVRSAGLASLSELVATLREDDDPALSEQVIDAQGRTQTEAWAAAVEQAETMPTAIVESNAC